ncbi:hypothetical protein FB45DRAFT_1067046 [Roridomyces roridus]|uniref:F-box domain-containing protein n=1 Tax=Roridomyces roridus TaxID=1738132 RepID=A0AAD7B2P5_9AGAR|nr:hypothetical protein FB45DRAFT_1067046 [Roridomyces roridus]
MDSQMTSICSECGATKIANAEPSDTIPATPETLAGYQLLAASNEPPNSAERAFLQAVASKSAVRLTCLDEEISRLKDRLGQLEAERSQLAGYHSQNVAILSPLRRMPHEILTEIFLWTLPPAASNPDVNESPWVLGQISSRWRAISLSTPSLWSAACLDYGGEPPIPQMIEAQVERAMVLKIHFLGSDAVESVPNTQREMFKTLSEHSGRWEELWIQLTPTLTPQLDELLRGRLPSLRKIYVGFEDPDIELALDSVKCFHTAPALVNATVLMSPKPILLPAHRLTSYRAACPWGDHERVLKMATNLVEAHIAIAFDNEPWPGLNDPPIDINLHRLQRLYVEHVEILNYLRAPLLDELAVDIASREDVLTPLKAFVVRSSCALRRFCMQGAPDADTTPEILNEYPSICSFTVVFTRQRRSKTELANALDAHLTMLTATCDRVAVSPHLTELCLGMTCTFPIDYSLFLEMLESRRGPNFSLQTTTFLAHANQMPEPVTRSRLDALGRGGLDVRLRGGSDSKREIALWLFEMPWLWKR